MALRERDAEARRRPYQELEDSIRLKVEREIIETVTEFEDQSLDEAIGSIEREAGRGMAERDRIAMSSSPVMIHEPESPNMSVPLISTGGSAQDGQSATRGLSSAREFLSSSWARQPQKSSDELLREMITESLGKRDRSRTQSPAAGGGGGGGGQHDHLSKYPKFVIPLADNLQLKKKSRAELKARVEPRNDASMTIEWFKDDVPIKATDRHSTYFNHGYAALIIAAFDFQDNGLYSCVATNSCGTDRTQATIRLDSRYLLFQSEAEQREDKIKKLIRIREAMKQSELKEAQRKADYALKRKQEAERELEMRRRAEMEKRMLRLEEARRREQAMRSRGWDDTGLKSSSLVTIDQAGLGLAQAAGTGLSASAAELTTSGAGRPYRTVEDSVILKLERTIYETIKEFEPEADEQEFVKRVSHARAMSQDEEEFGSMVKRQSEAAQKEFLVRKREKSGKIEQMAKMFDRRAASDVASASRSLPPYRAAAQSSSRALAEVGAHSSQLESGSSSMRDQQEGQIRYVWRPYRLLEDSIILRREKTIFETIREFEPELALHRSETEIDCRASATGAKEVPRIVGQPLIDRQLQTQESDMSRARKSPIMQPRYIERDAQKSIQLERLAGVLSGPRAGESELINLDTQLDELNRAHELEQSGNEGPVYIWRPYQEREDTIILRRERTIIETVVEFEDDSEQQALIRAHSDTARKGPDRPTTETWRHERDDRGKSIEERTREEIHLNVRDEMRGRDWEDTKPINEQKVHETLAQVQEVDFKSEEALEEAKLGAEIASTRQMPGIILRRLRGGDADDQPRSQSSSVTASEMVFEVRDDRPKRAAQVVERTREEPTERSTLTSAGSRHDAARPDIELVYETEAVISARKHSYERPIVESDWRQEPSPESQPVGTGVISEPSEIRTAKRRDKKLTRSMRTGDGDDAIEPDLSHKMSATLSDDTIERHYARLIKTGGQTDPLRPDAVDEEYESFASRLSASIRSRPSTSQTQDSRDADWRPSRGGEEEHATILVDDSRSVAYGPTAGEAKPIPSSVEPSEGDRDSEIWIPYRRYQAMERAESTSDLGKVEQPSRLFAQRLAENRSQSADRYPRQAPVATRPRPATSLGHDFRSSSEVLAKYPRFMTPLLDNSTIRKRARVELKSRVEPIDDESMRIEWFKDDVQLRPSHRISMYFNYGYASIVIRGFDESDEGRYTCVASNSLGQDRASARLQLDKRYNEQEAEVSESKRAVVRLAQLRDAMKLAERMEAEKRAEYVSKTQVRAKLEIDARLREEQLRNEARRARSRALADVTQELASERAQIQAERERQSKVTADRRASYRSAASTTAARDYSAAAGEGFITEEESSPSLRRWWRPYRTLEDSIILKREREIVETTTEFEDVVPETAARTDSATGPVDSQHVETRAQLVAADSVEPSSAGAIGLKHQEEQGELRRDKMEGVRIGLPEKEHESGLISSRWSARRLRGGDSIRLGQEEPEPECSAFGDAHGANAGSPNDQRAWPRQGKFARLHDDSETSADRAERDERPEATAESGWVSGSELQDSTPQTGGIAGQERIGLGALGEIRAQTRSLAIQSEESDGFEEDSFIYADLKQSESPSLDQDILRDRDRLTRSSDPRDARRKVVLTPSNSNEGK